MVLVWIVGLLCGAVVLVAAIEAINKRARWRYRLEMAQRGFWRGREGADLEAAEERAERAEGTAVALFEVREGTEPAMSDRATEAIRHARELRDAAAGDRGSDR